MHGLLYHQKLLIISCKPFPFCISFRTKRQRWPQNTSCLGWICCWIEHVAIEIVV